MIEEFKRETGEKKAPRKVTPNSLENAALYYLQRFSTSSYNFRRVMLRRVFRSAQYHGTDLDEGAQIVDDLILRYNKAGLLDDRRFAEARVNSLYRRGTSARVIRLKLAEKGVSGDIITETLRHLQDENQDPELTSGVTLARRRRLGPFRVAPDRATFKVKDMATLARAGFDYNTAQKIIDAETIEKLELLIENSISSL